MGYSWLAEKKAEAMKKKLVQRGTPNYRQMPIGERYGATFTGYGPDGKLDRNAVAGIETDVAGRQHAYHEGEEKIDMPEGSLYINSDMMNMTGPRTQQDQSEANLYAKRGNLPGFRSGGYEPMRGYAAGGMDIPGTPVVGGPGFTPLQNSSGPGFTPLQNPESPNNPPLQNPSTPTITPLQNPPGQTFTPLQNGSNLPGVSPIKFDIPTTEKFTQTSSVIAGQQRPTGEELQLNYTPPEMVTIKPREIIREASTPDPIKFDIPQQTIVPPVLAGREAPTFDPIKFGVQPSTGTQPAETPPAGATPTTTTTKPTAIELEGQRATDEQALRQQQERSALEQRLIQQGVDPSRARLEGQLLRNTQESELAGTAAKYGIANAQAKQDDEKYKDTQDWKAYESAIAAGDFTTAASAYQRVTGNPISMDQMRTYQGYLNQKNQQELTTGALGIQSLTTRVGSEKVNAISEAIGKGMSLSQINTQYPDMNLTADEFKSMYENTPAGERNWNRDMAYAQTLIEAGGADNINNAAKIYNERFPGTGIDFSGIITKDTAKTFNQGLSQLSSYVAAWMDYDEAIAAMEKDGSLKMMNMDTPEGRKDVEKLYKSLKVNAIDEQWDTISGSDWYKGLPPQDQSDMQTFFGAVLSGKLDYSIQKEYTVTAADGTTQTMTMTDAAAAGYATSNPGVKITATGKTQVVPRTTVTDNKPPPVPVAIPSGKTEGNYFTKDGKLYKVESNSAVVAELPSDSWGAEADSILAIGGEYARQIGEARAADILAGTKTWQSIKGTDDPTYKALVASSIGENGYGDVTDVNPSGGGNDRHAYSNLEAAYSSGGLIRKDGKLYAVTNLTIDEHGWKNWTNYVLTEVGSKNTVSVTAKG